MWEVAIVYGSFLVAAITAAACARRAGIASSSTVGPPVWDYTKSWGTNVAVFGALFGTFTSKLVPSPKYVMDPGYPLMTVVFALLALVAPIVFAAMSDVKQVKKDGVWDIQTQGTVTGFYIAMVFTLWAALGQLSTLGALTFEVINTHKVPDLTAVILLILLVAAASVVAYAWRTSAAVMKRQATAHDDIVESKTKDAPMPSWSLL